MQSLSRDEEIGNLWSGSLSWLCGQGERSGLLNLGHRNCQRVLRKENEEAATNVIEFQSTYFGGGESWTRVSVALHRQGAWRACSTCRTRTGQSVEKIIRHDVLSPWWGVSSLWRVGTSGSVCSTSWSRSVVQVWAVPDLVVVVVQNCLQVCVQIKCLLIGLALRASKVRCYLNPFHGLWVLLGLGEGRSRRK